MTSITTHDKLETETTVAEGTAAANVVLDALSDSTFRLSPGQSVLPGPLDLNPAGLDRGMEDEGVKLEDTVTEPTLDEIPPTPPLTRSENPHGEVDETLDEPVEVDVAKWHPLDRTQRASKDMNQTQDTTFVDDSLVLDSDEKYLPVAAPRKQTSNASLRIIPKPPSPQPWDTVDPSSHGEGTDFFSTLGTKNFGTMQKNRYTSFLFLRTRSSHIVSPHSRSRPPIPHSSYYFGPPPVDSAYGTNPIGHIGIHHPREIFRVERDYTGGELVQFAATYPLELEGRVCDPVLFPIL